MNDRVTPYLVPAYGDLLVNPQEVPLNALAGLNAEATAALLAAAADISLVIDRHGVISSVCVGSPELAHVGHSRWVGKRWVDTVTAESRSKVSALMEDSLHRRPRKWRHINCPLAQGGEAPLLFSAVQVGDHGQLVAFGRDLRQVAQLQQRLVGAQLSLERDYLRLRHMETRFRQLFETISDAVLLVNTSGQKVVEANPPACQLLGASSAADLAGRTLPELIDAEHALAVADYLGGVRATGSGDVVLARLAASGQDVRLRASLLRHESGSSYVVHLEPRSGMPITVPGRDPAYDRLKRVVDAMPDAYVITDTAGRVMASNQAFLDLTQEPAAEQVLQQPLERWLGRAGVDQNVLLSHLKQSGRIRLFATSLRGRLGTLVEVEISAAFVPETDPACMGFAIRDVGRRLVAEAPSRHPVPRTVEQMAELVGRVPLKEIVGETTDLIEQFCIEAALELTRGNRASAAEMLGLSRQSLYVKLRRFSLIGDQDAEG